MLIVWVYHCVLCVVPADTAPVTEFTGTCTPLIDAAEEAGLTALVAALEATNLVERATAGDANLTLFAPTNAALEEVLGTLGLPLEDLADNVELLSEVLLYHILPSAQLVVDLTAGEEFTTALGDDSSCGVGTVGVEVDEEVTIVGGESSANIEIPDVETCSGIVHIIDAVLLPCPVATDVSPEGEY